MLELPSPPQLLAVSDAVAMTAADWEELYREQYAFVWRNVRRLGCDMDLVDDVVHDVFLVAARRIEEFRGDASIRTWLFAIAYRMVSHVKRGRARYERRLQDYAHAVDQHAESPQEHHDASRYLLTLLSQLDEAYRVVVILAELEGMTAVEISKSLGVPVGTVHTRLRSARNELKAMLRRDQARDRRLRHE